MKTPKFYHPCAKCGKKIETHWKFCGRCSGFKKSKRRRKKDAIHYRLPGSFGTGKRQ